MSDAVYDPRGCVLPEMHDGPCHIPCSPTLWWRETDQVELVRRYTHWALVRFLDSDAEHYVFSSNLTVRP